MTNIYEALKQPIQSAQTQSTQQKPLMSKEEFAKYMFDKRNKLYDIASKQTDIVTHNPKEFVGFLDLQAKFDYTVTNTLLIMAQNPKATLLKDYYHWKAAKAYLMKNAQKIEILEPSGEYEKNDGSIGINYNPKTLYDVSSISYGKRFIEKPNEYSPNELVSSIIYRASVLPEVVSNDSTLPEDVFFDENSKTVYVKDGQEPNKMINGLLREYAFVECYEHGISRQEASFVAQSAGYLLSQKYHVDGYDTSFASECLNYFNDIDSFEAKKELENIKSVSSQVSERMEHGLYTMQQNRQPKQTERSNYER